MDMEGQHLHRRIHCAIQHLGLARHAMEQGGRITPATESHGDAPGRGQIGIQLGIQHDHRSPMKNGPLEARNL